MSTFAAPPSFADFAKEAQIELNNKGGGFLSKLTPGEYKVQFLGATMVKNEFAPGYIPEYRFNHDGVEKTLRSASKSLAANLLGKEGATITLIKGENPKTRKTFWDAR